ncbi:hypothetical protein [Saccharopolyspora phatthalungensis]|uniref:Quinol-cytochrome oxidoreductase complex cytochrome b subunit n=1 Tax=Saccharopolyspora phatthalungensis TaxID=664693 RepID=A0A840QAS6_9PSEU|nr:hypothetical protein [Saccharopolyspora phatthalungensis]MBB5156920.1 quinol-cytochrome oxidoreductase complex cytochrome b subunit [Saccharopolyspora phatthalungensis]
MSVHLLLVWYQKRSHFRGPGARETNVVGDRAAPGFMARTLANGVAVVGVVSLLGAVFQINPVFLWGPYTPSDSSTGVQPDWYIGFLIGALRLFPPWDINIGPFAVPAPFWPGIALPAVMFLIAGIYPFLERLVTRDRARHNILQRPRDNAARTGIGAMAITFYLVLLGAGGDDVLAAAFSIPFEWLVWAGRIAVFVLPAIAYVLGDQHALDRATGTDCPLPPNGKAPRILTAPLDAPTPPAPPPQHCSSLPWGAARRTAGRGQACRW